jgi:hypothetical protein
MTDEELTVKVRIDLCKRKIKELDQKIDKNGREMWESRRE